MLLPLGKALLKGTVCTQEARVISAVRLCAKVAFAVKGDFYIGEGTDLGFSVCGSSAVDPIQFCI